MSARLINPVNEACWFFPLIAAFLFVVFCPILLGVYDYHDSFQFFLSATREHPCGYHPPFLNTVMAGRPLYNVIYCLTVPKLMHGVDTAGFVRAEGLIIMAISATMLFYYLRRCGLSLMPAAFAAIFCFLLPGPQEFVYTSHGTVIMWAFPFVIGSAICLLSMMEATFADRWIESILFAVCSIALLIISSLTYQNVSEVFLALLFVRLLTPPNRILRLGLLYLVGGGLVFVLQLAIYLAINWLFIMPFVLSAGMSVPDALAARVKMAPTLSADAFWLFGQRLLRGTTLWFYGTGPFVSILVIILVAGLGVLMARDPGASKTTARDLRHRMWWSFGLLVLFVLLTNALPFVQPETRPPLPLLFRTMIAFQWVLIFFIVFAVAQLSQSTWMRPYRAIVFGGYAGVSLVSAGFVACNLYYNFVLLNVAEFAYMKRIVIESTGRLPAVLCVIQPDSAALGTLSQFLVIDEFGRTTTTFSFDVGYFIIAAAASAEVGLDWVQRFVVFHANARPTDVGCGLTVDMRWLD